MEITHTVDGIRYFCISRVLSAEKQEDKPQDIYDDDDELEDYNSYMTGGEITDSYITA